MSAEVSLELMFLTGLFGFLSPTPASHHHAYISGHPRDHQGQPLQSALQCGITGDSLYCLTSVYFCQCGAIPHRPDPLCEITKTYHPNGGGTSHPACLGHLNNPPVVCTCQTQLTCPVGPGTGCAGCPMTCLIADHLSSSFCRNPECEQASRKEAEVPLGGSSRVWVVSAADFRGSVSGCFTRGMIVALPLPQEPV